MIGKGEKPRKLARVTCPKCGAKYSIYEGAVVGQYAVRDGSDKVCNCVQLEPWLLKESLWDIR